MSFKSFILLLAMFSGIANAKQAFSLIQKKMVTIESDQFLVLVDEDCPQCARLFEEAKGHAAKLKFLMLQEPSFKWRAKHRLAVKDFDFIEFASAVENAQAILKDIKGTPALIGQDKIVYGVDEILKKLNL